MYWILYFGICLLLDFILLRDCKNLHGNINRNEIIAYTGICLIPVLNVMVVWILLRETRRNPVLRKGKT